MARDRRDRLPAVLEYGEFPGAAPLGDDARRGGCRGGRVRHLRRRRRAGSGLGATGELHVRLLRPMALVLRDAGAVIAFVVVWQVITIVFSVPAFLVPP